MTALVLHRALVCAVCAFNLFCFCLMAFDKARARRGARRVPEASLLGCAACFGAPGIYLGMLAFHHKTRKTKFILVPALMALQAGLVCWLAFFRR